MKTILLLGCILLQISADAICDRKTLLAELQQDMEDNGHLDCLRLIPAPHGKETSDQINKRLAAQWDSDCSFEAVDGWWKSFRFKDDKDLKLTLFSVDHAAVESDSDLEADMCEFIRALYFSGNLGI